MCNDCKQLSGIGTVGRDAIAFMYFHKIRLLLPITLPALLSRIFHLSQLRSGRSREWLFRVIWSKVSDVFMNKVSTKVSHDEIDGVAPRFKKRSPASRSALRAAEDLERGRDRWTPVGWHRRPALTQRLFVCLMVAANDLK